MNPILLSDSYKYSHYKQYPPNTTKVYSYFESRGGEFDETLFFGLQYIIKKYLTTPINHEHIREAKELIDAHMGPNLFNLEGWSHIVEKHGGYLPLEIKAVREGSLVPFRNVLMTVENTCPECFWLTNFMESLLVQVWYPMTVATLSYEMKKVILGSLRRSGDPSLIDFKLQDFGFRGVSSVESAAIGGLAHLVNFKGTDTIQALLAAREYYDEPMAGFSIPAAEHSTIISWGQDGELDAYRNMLKQFPTGLVAVVSDSYDIMEACDFLWGTHLKEEVLDRTGIVIIRPDSGVPHEIVPDVFDVLSKRFEFTVNDKGFKELPPQLAVIQGDGMDYDECGRILEALNRRGWSSNQLGFGMGGALLQRLHRDTQRCAFKCSYVEVDGTGRDVYKSTAQDPSKASKAGRMKLYHDDRTGKWRTCTESDNMYRSLAIDYLEQVFLDGTLTRDENLATIRERVNKGLIESQKSFKAVSA